MLARPTISSVSHLLERHPTGFVFAFRFIYGLRTVSPVAIGATRIPAAKFVLLNAAAALVWGPLFTALGYFAGQGIQQLLGRLPLPHHLLIAAAAFVCVIALAVVFRRQLMKLAAKI